MAVIDYVGNINSETQQVSNLVYFVNARIGEISTAIESLESCWKDENSATFLSKQKQTMEELTTASADCEKKAYEYLEEVKNILKIYVS